MSNKSFLAPQVGSNIAMVIVALTLEIGCTNISQPKAVTVWQDVRSIPAAGYESAEGYFEERGVDTPQSGPAIVVTDDQDNVWVALAKSGKLAKYANGTFTLFEIGKDSRPVGLAAGTRRNGYPGEVWIAASYDNKILRFDERIGVVKEYKIPGDNSWPFNIAIDRHGKIWFTQRASGRLGRLDPSNGDVRHYKLANPNAGPAGLGIDPTDGRIWFTESYADRVGVLDPVSGAIEEYQMGTASTGLTSGPAGLAIDTQGGIWFAKLEGKLGHIPPGGHHIELTDVPPEARRPAGIAVSASGDVWTLALDGNLLLRFDPTARRFTQYPLPVGAPDAHPDKPPTARTSRPFGLAFDRQGNLWFSQQYTGQLGVLGLAPPEITILAPGDRVRFPYALLSTRVADRVAGVPKLDVTVDGARVNQHQGRLDLSRLKPGKHILEVQAIDEAGRAARAQQSFDYDPAEAAVLPLVKSLKLKDSQARALKDQLVMLAQDTHTPHRFLDMRQMISGHQNEFLKDEYNALVAVLGWVDEHAQNSKVVQILDAAPFFEPQEVTIKKGDSITWLYSDDSGHGGTHALHQIQIPLLGKRSEMMRSGENFTVQFDQTGQFKVENSKKQNATCMVKVIQ